MKLYYYSNIQHFLDDLKEVLLEKEEVNQLILFNANNMMLMEKTDDQFFGSIRNEADELKVVFLHLPPYNLLISSLGQIEPFEIIMLAEDIAGKYPNIRGINANKVVADLFCPIFSNMTKTHTKTHFALSVMKLSKVLDCQLPNGSFKVAKESDIPLIIQWNKEFFEEIGESIEVLETHIQKITTRVGEGKYYLFEDQDGHFVSMAAASRYLTYGVAIGPVYTAKHARNKGYGMAVVHHLSNKLLQEGHQYVTLYVDQMNPISNRVYLKIGFYIVEDQYDMRFIRSITNEENEI